MQPIVKPCAARLAAAYDVDADIAFLPASVRAWFKANIGQRGQERE